MIHQRKDQRDVPAQIRHLLQSPQGWDLLIKATERKKPSRLFSKQEEHRGKAVHNSSLWPEELVVILPTHFRSSRKLPALRVSTQHARNWELLNSLPKTGITAHCSMLCPLDVAHKDTGKWPIHCNLNTFVLGRSLGCWDQHLTCFSLLSTLQSLFAHQ